MRSDALFQVNFIIDKLSPGLRRRLHIVFAGVALFICIIFVWKTADVAMSSLSRGKFAPTVLRTPLWIPQMLMPAGFAVIAVFLLEKLVVGLRQHKGNE